MNFPLRCCSLARSSLHTSKTAIRGYSTRTAGETVIQQAHHDSRAWCIRLRCRTSGPSPIIKETCKILASRTNAFLHHRECASNPENRTVGVVWHLHEREIWLDPQPHVPVLFSLHCQIGEISYLSVFGQPMIILNSLEAINEIFLKRSAIYSDRPKSIIAGEMYALAQRLNSEARVCSFYFEQHGCGSVYYSRPLRAGVANT